MTASPETKSRSARSRRRSPVQVDPLKPTRAPSEQLSRSRVAVSPFRDAIEELLKAGWAARRVERFLRERYAAEPELAAAIPSHGAMSAWAKKNLRPKDVVPASLLNQMLGKAAVDIDVVGELQVLIPVLANRLGAALRFEQSLGGPAVDAVDKAAKTYLDALAMIWRIGQDLGMYPNKPVPPITLIDRSEHTAVSFQAYAEQASIGLTPEEWTAVHEVLYEMRHGESLPTLNELESPAAKRMKAVRGS